MLANMASSAYTRQGRCLICDQNALAEVPVSMAAQAIAFASGRYSPDRRSWNSGSSRNTNSVMMSPAINATDEPMMMPISATSGCTTSTLLLASGT